MNEKGSQKRLAVLIDADNAQASIIDSLFEEIANLGVASVKRIYGDWTSPNLKSWKEVLQTFSIQPIQQFAYTTGKNATDSALIIDAMDLLFSENFDGFCIVSSDSDFTRLAGRLREDGLTVYGFGERKTPKAFVVACDRFIFTENLRLREEGEAGPEKAVPPQKLNRDSWLINNLRHAIEDAADDDGWANLGTVGLYIANKHPDFDPRNYGYKKLGELMKAINLFDIDERKNLHSSAKSIYVKDKRRKAKETHNS